MRTYFGQKAHKNVHIKNFQKAHKCECNLAKGAQKCAHKNFQKAPQFWPRVHNF